MPFCSNSKFARVHNIIENSDPSFSPPPLLLARLECEELRKEGEHHFSCAGGRGNLMECTSHEEEEESLFQKGLFVCARAHTHTHTWTWLTRSTRDACKKCQTELNPVKHRCSGNQMHLNFRESIQVQGLQQ